MRKPRLDIRGGLYHVVTRGNLQRKVFVQKDDFSKYLTLLGEQIGDGEIELHAYCLNPKKVHLLVRQKGRHPLSRAMHRLQSAYVHYFNHKYKKGGHLFQGRYQADLVDPQRYGMDLIRYIHLNPERPKLEKKPGTYPWTSHFQYLGEGKKFPAAVEKSALQLFSKKKGQAAKAYRQFMGAGTGKKYLEDFRGRGGILGDDRFRREILKKAGLPAAPNGTGLQLKLSLPRMWRLLQDREQAKGPQGRLKSRLVEECAYLATEGGGKTQRQVAEYFGMDQAGISLALKRLKKRWQGDVKTKKSFLKWAKSLGNS